MSSDIEICGTHGTSVTRYEAILKNGFVKQQGRAGCGVYFWADNPYSVYLAQGWWKFQTKKNAYQKDTNQECAVIKAKFLVKEENFIDLNDKFLNEKLAEHCLKNNITFNTATNECAALITGFIEDLERKISCEFKLLELTVSFPVRGYAEDYPLQVLGSPKCCVVFDTNCIQIVDK